jgi:hypothetical protein
MPANEVAQNPGNQIVATDTLVISARLAKQQIRAPQKQSLCYGVETFKIAAERLSKSMCFSQHTSPPLRS